MFFFFAFESLQLIFFKIYTYIYLLMEKKNN